MAGFSISIESKRLRGAIARGSRLDLEPAFRDIGEIMVRSINDNFRAGGRPDRWAPLAASTRRSKRGNKTLIETGRLLRSITYAADPNGVTVGTNTVYAATHHFGRDTIPARPFIVVQSSDIPRIQHAISRHMESLS